MKQFGYPLFFDVTHALQKPGGRADSADGRRSQVADLGRAGMSQGIAGLFLESHPEPDKAKCDGPCALRLDRLVVSMCVCMFQQDARSDQSTFASMDVRSEVIWCIILVKGSFVDLFFHTSNGYSKYG